MRCMGAFFIEIFALEDLMTDVTATYSPDDTKLRLYPGIHRLDTDDYNLLKANGFQWAPKQELFVAPMWTPAREDILLQLAGEISDEYTSLVDRAEERADRFVGYSNSRAFEAESLIGSMKSLADNILFGQPILVGHHSEKNAHKHAEQIETACVVPSTHLKPPNTGQAVS